MKTSETTKEIYPAIIGLQSEMETIARDKTVSQGKFSFKYAPLDSIMEKIKPLFAARGLAAIFLIAAYLMGRNDTPTDIDDRLSAADDEIRNRPRLG